MSETNDREVNVDDTAEDVSDDPELDEEVIPAGALEETDETASQPTTPASSPEVKDGEPGEEPVAPPAPSQKQPAPVPGETPREKALRLEIERLRGLNRAKQVSDIANSVPSGEQTLPNELQERYAKLRATYSDEEIRNMEEAIDVLAQTKGYVKAEQSYQSTVNTTLETFIEANPEYKPENDPGDVRWLRFKETLESGIYNLAGKTPKQLQAIFRRAHQDVLDELGEPEARAEDRKIAAQQQKIRSVSHSGGTKTTPAAPKTVVDPSVRNIFKGFDEGDFE